MRASFRLFPLAAALFLLVGSCSSPTDTPSVHSLKDVFPLAKGDVFTYSYNFYLLQRDGYPSYATSDSGLVAYRVLDSIFSPEAREIHWVVEETQHVLHQEFQYVLGSYPSLVNSVWRDTTRQLSISESIDSLHEIKSNGLVWNFPLTDSILGLGSMTAHCIRFSSDSPVMVKMSQQVSEGALFAGDTLRFEEAVGFTDRTYQQSGWAMTASRGGLRIHLLSGPNPSQRSPIYMWHKARSDQIPSLREDRGVSISQTSPVY